MRVGQKNKLTYRWARKGSRPRAARDQRTQSTYLFGAVCPEHGTGAALVLPFCNTEAMQLHLDEIATKVSARAQQPREYLAVHATELAVEPNLQIHRRRRRSLLLCMEHAHQSALENHVYRPPRLGSHRSLNLRIGISA